MAQGRVARISNEEQSAATDLMRYKLKTALVPDAPSKLTVIAYLAQPDALADAFFS